jgi:hypothetical protein
MCRWNAFFGQPVLNDDLLFTPRTATAAVH